MAVDWFALNHQSYIRKLLLIQEGKEIFIGDWGRVVNLHSWFMLLHVQSVSNAVRQTLVYETLILSLRFLVSLGLLSVVFLA